MADQRIDDRKGNGINLPYYSFPRGLGDTKLILALVVHDSNVYSAFQNYIYSEKTLRAVATFDNLLSATFHANLPISYVFASL